MGIYAQEITADMYHQQESERLDKLTENEFHNLLILPDKMAGIALRLIVTPEQIRAGADGEQRFGLRYTDRDLQPVNRQLHMARLANRYWQPDKPLPVRSRHKQTQADQGFFTPHQSEIDEEFLLFSAELQRQASS